MNYSIVFDVLRRGQLINMTTSTYDWKISDANDFPRHKKNNYVESDVFLLHGYWWVVRFYPFKHDEAGGVAIKIFCLTGNVIGQMSIYLENQEIGDSENRQFVQYRIYSLSNLSRHLVENALAEKQSWRIQVKLTL